MDETPDPHDAGPPGTGIRRPSGAPRRPDRRAAGAVEFLTLGLSIAVSLVVGAAAWGICVDRWAGHQSRCSPLVGLASGSSPRCS